MSFSKSLPCRCMVGKVFSAVGGLLLGVKNCVFGLAVTNPLCGFGQSPSLLWTSVCLAGKS